MSTRGLEVAQVDGLANAPIAEGTRVQVRNQFEGSWSRGFEIYSLEVGGYRVRRLSDGAVLPTVIAESDLRMEHPAVIG
ncbi:MAG TPA: hypothetical protein VFA11_03005 [Acidimicrobiales bacterium]|nr:hypothetical protein [Acidimicrobiales bacterium]